MPVAETPHARQPPTSSSFFDERVGDAQREAANHDVLEDMKSHLNEQDTEEGY